MWQFEAISQEKKPLGKMESVRSCSWGGKRGLKIEFLGASSFFDHPTRSFFNSPNYQSNLNAQFLILFT